MFGFTPLTFGQNGGLFWSFPYVCPEPVLVNDAFYIYMAHKMAFFAPSQRAVLFTIDTCSGQY
jgi:hypothetical protein